MRRRTSVLDRLVALAAGCVLLAASGLTLAWAFDVDWARAAVRRVDRARLAAVPDESWWPTMLATTAVIALLGGLVLLVVNLRRGRPETMPVFPGGVAEADLSVDLGPLAVGLADELAALDGVRTVRSTAVDDRGLATLRVTVVADPTVDVVDFTRSAEAMARSMAAALPGAPVATQVLLHLDPTDR
ncbi:hypothetical protein ACFWPA_16735 [Rhodococcus sp. NPDC058505]|uniref:hypothetical protein n=1 Tax=unclassified Rhodococcus (in: high G+C Gram-positive bacteria) TaxID=192944 RepID=UPI003653892B